MLSVPAIASAAPASNTGTLVGAVTCGADQVVPAAHVDVTVPGTNLSTQTDASGNFVLSGVPALQNVSVEAIADPEASITTDRSDFSVQPGETLNVGSIDLSVCGQPNVDTTPQYSVPDDQQSPVGADY
jgi:hypothetical protein